MAVDEGRDLADEGGFRAYLAQAVDDWRPKAQAVLDRLAASGATFTADDVTEEVGVPRQPNAVGGLFRANRGALEAVGYTQAGRTQSHARVLRVWRGAPRRPNAGT